MTTDEFLNKYIEWERYCFFLNKAFIYGGEYCIKKQVWIEWEFERYFKRMSSEEKEKRIKEFIRIASEIRKDGER